MQPVKVIMGSRNLISISITNTQVPIHTKTNRQGTRNFICHL